MAADPAQLRMRIDEQQGQITALKEESRQKSEIINGLQGRVQQLEASFTALQDLFKQHTHDLQVQEFKEKKHATPNQHQAVFAITSGYHEEKKLFISNELMRKTTGPT